eukprot:Nitzschia sp. Nitz4//scaffold4_size323378//282401//283706//NITZ4_000708-RA/size323378-snap-gene-0.477-mRNA-1//-1//CDS//3329553543//6347//frame0
MVSRPVARGGGSMEAALSPMQRMVTMGSEVVAQLGNLIEQRPTTFEITILPTVAVSPIEESHNGNDNTVKSTKKKISNQELSLQDSLILMDGHLGLDARSLPWMTRDIRKEYKRLKSQPNRFDLLSVTSCLLLVNPDHATAWADRRRCLLHKIEERNNTDGWINELSFLNLLMTQHSKAPSSWGHRKYVLNRLLRGDPQGDHLQLVENEIRLCRSVADKYPKNYYAWTHRRFLWHVVEPSAEQLQREWDDITLRWLPQHVSDHSSAHYASQVLSLWIQRTSDTHVLIQVLTDARDRVQELVQGHYSHETIWILRRLVARLALENVRRCDAIASLVREDIHLVEQEVFSSNGTNCVHALTYLTWVHKLCPPLAGNNSLFSEESTILTVRGLLQSHEDIHHNVFQSLHV